jgi:hypothetical protein
MQMRTKFNFVARKSSIIIFSLFNLLLLLYFIRCSNEKPPPEGGPFILLSPSQTYGEIPLTVSFNITVIPSSGKIKKLIIDYGNGTQEDITNSIKGDKVAVTKTYESLGVFEVQLIGMDDSGVSQAKTTIITNDRPTILNPITARDEDFAEITSEFSPGSIVYFKAICKDTNGISKVIIDWGDGSNEETNSCYGEHRYINEGDYTLKVLVLDDNKFAPYPLSASVEIVISVFSGAASPENSPPTIFGQVEKILEPEKEVYRNENMAIGIPPFTVQILIGVSDRDGDKIDYIIVEWGDGTAQKLDPNKYIIASGSKYIFRTSYTYTKEGSFSISIIVKDSAGKVSIQKIADVHSFKSSPSIYVEAKDNLGKDPQGGSFDGGVTVSFHILAFDDAPYDIYFVLRFTSLGGQKEKLVYKMNKEGRAYGLVVNDFQVSLTSPGNYNIEIFAVADILDVVDIYCSENLEPLNESVYEKVPYNVYFGSTAECDKSDGKITTGAKVKKSQKIEFKIVR